MMKIYPLGHATLEESKELSKNFNAQVQNMKVSDDDLKSYVKLFFHNYRATIERFFQTFSKHIPLYADYPFETSVFRLGENGVITGHSPYKNSIIRILRSSDFDPPLSSMNIFDIQKRLKAKFLTFSFVHRRYDASEAEIDGKRQALNDALNLFFHLVEPLSFAELCKKIIKAEGINLAQPNTGDNDKFDAKGEIIFDEPGGSRRVEIWAFDYKTYKRNRISARELRETEQFLESNQNLDVICLITSGDLTSIGNNIVVNNPRIRIWDRYILKTLVNNHLDILEGYFSGYKIAFATLQEEFEKKQGITSNLYKTFKAKLENCPAGREHFSAYENICVDIFKIIFSSKLGEPKYQSKTYDQKQRRDILFRNQQTDRFFQRVANKFNADFIILDCKNYSEPVGPDVVFDVAKYINKALGRFIIVASRHGANSSVEAAQLRVLRDDDAIIIVISDEQLLEMLNIYENKENPEDVLEDLVDEILLRY